MGRDPAAAVFIIAPYLFREEAAEMAWRFAHAGKVPLHCIPPIPPSGPTQSIDHAMIEKINLGLISESKEVFVVNVGGYIPPELRRLITLARGAGLRFGYSLPGRCSGDYETCPCNECSECGHRDCQWGDQMHYHHDGCPSCAEWGDQ